MIILSGANGALDADQDLECNRLYDCAVWDVETLRSDTGPCPTRTSGTF